jgi:hypothetical protein
VRALILIALVACGGSQTPAPNNDTPTPPPPAHDTRTPFEQRRDTACKQLAPKLTECAAQDAKADLDAGKTTQQQYSQDTAPKVLEKNTQDFVDKCTTWRDMSSRQLRVLEVCFKQETECGPLRACLDNLEAKPQ